MASQKIQPASYYPGTCVDGFRKAILEQPSEIGPRLVWADWLDEQGEGDFAEYIRLSCSKVTKKLYKLQHKIWPKIVGSHSRLFENPTQKGDGTRKIVIDFKLGLPSELWMNAGDYVMYIKKISKMWPIERIFLWHWDWYYTILGIDKRVILIEENWQYHNNLDFPCLHYPRERLANYLLPRIKCPDTRRDIKRRYGNTYA